MVPWDAILGVMSNDLSIPDGSRVVYSATSESVWLETESSVKQLRKVNAEVSIILYTAPEFVDEPMEGVTRVEVIDNPFKGFRDKVVALNRELVHGGRVLFLDGDIYVRDRTMLPDLLGSILGRFPFAASHACAPQRGGFEREINGVPSAFNEVNSGVIAMDYTSPHIQDLLPYWLEIYDEVLDKQGRTEDQISLRIALWNSNIPFYVLPHDYNVLPITYVQRRFPARAVHAHNMQAVRNIVGRSCFMPAEMLTKEDRLMYFRHKRSKVAKK